MFKKLNIKIFKVPVQYNSGFIIDYNNNSIINLDKNYTLPLPFNTTLMNTLYLFEILECSDYLVLTLILNTLLCSSYMCISNLLEYKKNLFKILNNRELPQKSFKKIHDIYNIIDSQSYEFNSHNLINMGANKYIDLSLECIKEKTKLLQLYKPHIFLVIGNSINLNTNYEYCIIDDQSNLIPEYTINSYNYNTINIETLYNWTNIHMSKEFFFSKKYSKPYSKFHSNSKSQFSYNNYRNYFSTLDPRDKCFNIELMEHKIFILKNIDMKKLLHHPLIYSNNTIIIVNNIINHIDTYNFKKICNRGSNITNKDDSIYLDPYKFYVYELYSQLIEIEPCSLQTFLGNMNQESIIFLYKNDSNISINDSEIESEIEMYKYSDDLLIENIISGIVIIDSSITMYECMNVFLGDEIYNINGIYKINDAK